MTEALFDEWNELNVDFKELEVRNFIEPMFTPEY